MANYKASFQVALYKKIILEYLSMKYVTKLQNGVSFKNPILIKNTYYNKYQSYFV